MYRFEGSFFMLDGLKDKTLLGKLGSKYGGKSIFTS